MEMKIGGKTVKLTSPGVQTDRTTCSVFGNQVPRAEKEDGFERSGILGEISA